MARSRYSNSLKNRANRLKPPIRKKPYKLLITPRVFICYRRNEGPGTWSVETGWLKRFAVADDFEDANGVSVMSFYQAQPHALKMVRGSEGGDSEKPVTVGEALDAYQTDLGIRGGSKWNATCVRAHMTKTWLAKTVALITETELLNWRDSLAVQERVEGLTAAEMLIMAAEARGPITFADIAMRRALNADKPQKQ